SMEGYGADDVIGTVSRICEENGVWCGIATGDKDDLQLASSQTNVLLTTTGFGRTTTDVYDDSAVKEKYGVTPKEFIAVKALMGDPSDNIPGVAGIGEKSAFELIKNFHSLDGLYENIDDPSIKKGQRQKLLDGRDMAYFCYDLCEIRRDIPLDFTLESAQIRDFDKEKLTDKLEQLELRKIAQRLDVKDGDAAETISDDSPSPASAEDIAAAEKAETLPFLLEEGEILFSVDGRALRTDPLSLKAALEGQSKKITHRYKSVKHELEKIGVGLNGDFYDTEIGEYILDPQQSVYDLRELCRREGKPYGPAALETVMNAQLKIIEERGQLSLLRDIELPLEEVLFSMENEGCKIDTDQLAAFGSILGERIEELEQTIYFLAGEKFNINSTKQLGTIVFEKLMLPVVKKSKRGYSTDSEVLEKLRSKHEIIDYIIEYRHAAKLKSTYTDALLPLVDSESRVHSTLNQTVTATGRISSTDPNLQNIPVRTELGREIRKMFVAREGHVLVDADYSQIELRVLAHIANDEAMCRAFRENEDIHRMTAMQVFGVPDFCVTDEMRARAKTVNFGIIYGQSEFSLAGELKITRKEAKRYIDSYFEKYSGVKEYMDRTVEQAKADGYVTTIFGRRRYVPELQARNFNLRSFGERVAMNAPIQGSAADIIKIAMVKVYNALKEECPNSRLILQIHDELIIEAPFDEAEKAARVLRREMENAASLSVPLVAEVKIGHSWYEAK
ncbi:MAG: DNA polymerase I, partial [Clostridia bacterium]